MINIQPIEKRVDHDGSVLDVHSIFYTIQGEGPFSGYPAVFIRLAGCNLQCQGCDTQYTEGRKQMTVEEIATAVWRALDPDNNRHLPIVVITGGEPFRQNLTPLCENLILGKSCFPLKVQIETNGTLAPSEGLPKKIVVVCSPKTPKLNKVIEQRIDFFKYVLSHDQVDKHDGLPHHVLDTHPAGGRVARPPSSYKRQIYLQPMDPGQNEQHDANYVLNVKAVVKSCMTFGHVVQLQTHKLLGVL